MKINVGKNTAQTRVMTAHGSKGLEFDYVFLPYALEESWIKKDRSLAFVLPKERESEDDIKDDRRLFYV
ncbi:3'-5' exonuclease, partial [Streptobacillus moniliformis]|uniref:3'-5' exonuclease n=1 Tax=Streptobacillus moniliformis TaxID=34105 RepID=UPI0034DCEA6A